MAANISQLKTLAKSQIARFVYDYLCGGYNQDLAVSNNRRALDSTYFQPTYLTKAEKADTSVEILDQTYASQFGATPLGLSGLIWPGASTFQAKDSGVESSVDLAKFLAQGVNIVFAGGAFMYDVGALGKVKARHVCDILQTDRLQVLGQFHCPHPNLLKNFRRE
jgi:isopentenyl diphosphate isomerase/L-lactate dehydrogenase-like FMN-dependent dehydrogenase